MANSDQAKCVSELQRMTADHPQFANFDDASAATGNDGSAAAASGPETPSAATPGQPKLKLTFNSGNRESVGINGGPMTGGSEDE